MPRKKKRPELTHCKVRECTHPKAPWRVSYKIEQEGRTVTKRKNFADEDAAWNFAEDQDREISNHGVRYGDIPPEVRRAFDFYRDESADLVAIGATVPRIEDLIANALADIRKAHAAREENALTVAEAVAQFTAYKQSRVGPRQLSDLKNRLRRFAQQYGRQHMRAISTADLESWLSSLRSKRNPEGLKEAPLLSPLARNHYRAALHALFKYAASPARGWCERNPVADLEPEKYDKGEPEAYSPEDAASLIQTALDQKPELVPVLALGLFCGLRVSEAINADLGKLPKSGEEFRTDGKTGPRMAPYTAAARAWIEAQPRRRGKAWQKSPRQLVDEMQSLFKLAELEAIDNGARHSFISYRTAELRDVARVADECGNSVSTIKNHYRQLVTSEAAKDYFAIRPEDRQAAKAKTVDIEQGRASA